MRETHQTWLKSTAQIAVLGALYYAAAHLGLRFSFEESNSSPVWPAAGIALSGLLLLGPRVWPVIWLAAFAAESIDFFRTAPAPPWTILWVSALLAAGSTLEALAGWFLCKRWLEPSTGNRWHEPLSTEANVFRFAALALLIGLISGCIGSTAICAAGIAPWSRHWLIWLIWWFGHASGILLVTPFLLAWAQPTRIRSGPAFWTEAGTAFGLLALTCWAVFSNKLEHTFVYMAIAPMVWIAARLGPRAVTSGLLFLSAWAIWQSIHGGGPFAGPSDFAALLRLLDFLWVASLTSMALVSTVTVRKKTEAALRKLTGELERRVGERTAELQRSNEALRQSEERFAAFMRNLPGFASMKDCEGRYVFCNEQLAAVEPGNVHERLGMTDDQFCPPEVAARIRANDDKVLETGAPVQSVETQEQEDGSRHWLVNRFPILNAAGAIILVGSISIEITERVRAEEQLRKALAKEIVLRREIHHRVKNNLQVIISLLYLQSAQVSDPKTLEILRESQMRARSIAITHEMLSVSGDLNKIEVAEYIRQIAAQLLSAYQVSSGTVALAIHAENIFLSLDTALPCGLIITELVSNALKYAFPNGREGRITIDLQPADTNLVNLAVSDNGVGLPEGFDVVNAPTMGLQLVRDLTRQLGGSMEFRRAHGTGVTITFANPDPLEIS